MEDLEKEISAAEETVQALRHALLKAELRLKNLQKQRPGRMASVGLGLRGWLEKQSSNLCLLRLISFEVDLGCSKLRRLDSRRLGLHVSIFSIYIYIFIY